MSDIVEMMRAAGRDDRLADGALYLKAADEIERLRAMVDRCNHHEHQLQVINAEVDKLRADSERYLSLAASYKSDLEEHTATIRRLRERDGFIEKLDEQIVSLNKEIERLQDVLISISCDPLDCEFACYYGNMKEHCSHMIVRLALGGKE